MNSWRILIVSKIKIISREKTAKFTIKDLEYLENYFKGFIIIIIFSGAVRGKTGKTSVLSRFSKIEGGSGGGAPQWCSNLALARAADIEKQPMV